MALVPLGMHPEMRSEMAQEYHRERENMQRARNPEPSPQFEVIAVNEDGEELFETELAYTREEAEELQRELNDLADAPKSVDHYAIRER